MAGEGDRGNFGSGALFLTLAGLGWVMIGLSALGSVSLGVLAVPVVCFGLLLVGIMSVRRAGKNVPPPPSFAEVDRVIAWATGAEVAAIVLLFVVLSLAHQTRWVMPGIALIVGLHFLPIAKALHRPLYVLTGLGLCVVAVAVPLWMPETSGAAHGTGWRLGVGVAGGIVIWLTALALLGLERKRLQL